MLSVKDLHLWTKQWILFCYSKFTHSLHGYKCLLRNKVIDHLHDIFSRILNFLMLILYCLNFQGLFIFLVHVPLNKKVSDTVFAVPYMYNLNIFNANAFYFCFLHTCNSMQPSFCLEVTNLTSFFQWKDAFAKKYRKVDKGKNTRQTGSESAASSHQVTRNNTAKSSLGSNHELTEVKEALSCLILFIKNIHLCLLKYSIWVLLNIYSYYECINSELH